MDAFYQLVVNAKDKDRPIQYGRGYSITKTFNTLEAVGELNRQLQEIERLTAELAEARGEMERILRVYNSHPTATDAQMHAVWVAVRDATREGE